jgi:hypothetical protein
MADIDLKTETPDTTLPTDGFLFGADSQSAASPSVYPVQSLATTLLGSTTLSGATVTADAPVLNLSQTWNASGVTFTGLKLNVTDTASAGASNLLDLRVGGTSRVIVSKSGSLFLNNSTMGISATTDRIIFGANSQFAVRANSFGATLRENAFFGWTNSFDASAATVDLGLTRRAAANLRLGFSDAAAPVAQTFSVQGVVAGTSNTAGANLTIAGSQGTGTGAGGSIVFQVAPAGATGTAQNSLATFAEMTSARAFNLYNTTDVTTNFERAKFAWESNVLRIGTAKGGTGTARALELQTDGTSRWAIGATTGHLLTGVDNTYDIGASGATRPRSIFVGTSVRTPQLNNNASTIGIEGVTSSFPAIKRSSTTLQVRLADDSGDAPLTAATLTASTVTASSTAANTSAIASTGYSLTGSSAVSLVDLAGTWNTTGTPTALKLNITDTASDAGSLLLDLQVGGTSKAKVDKDGDILTTGSVTTAAPAGGTAAAWKLGARVADTTTLDTTQYIEVDVGGTLYKLALVTV